MLCNELYINDYVEKLSWCFDMMNQVYSFNANEILSKLCSSAESEDIEWFSPFLIDGLSSAEFLMKVFNVKLDEIKDKNGRYGFYSWIGEVIAYYHATHDCSLNDLLGIDWEQFHGTCYYCQGNDEPKAMVEDIDLLLTTNKEELK